MEITVIKTAENLSDETPKGFVLTFYDSMDDAVSYLIDEISSKLVSKSAAIDFWDRLFALDFKKLVMECEEEGTSDSTFIEVEMKSGEQGVKLLLENPDFERYEAEKKSESLKALKIVKEMNDFIGCGEKILDL